jgi:hypothetical protein
MSPRRCRLDLRRWNRTKIARKNENLAWFLTWRGVGKPPAKERNSQRAPLGEPVGAVVVSFGCMAGKQPLLARKSVMRLTYLYHLSL